MRLREFHFHYTDFYYRRKRNHNRPGYNDHRHQCIHRNQLRGRL